MLAVADHLNLDESEAVPEAYSLAMWRRHYPAGIAFHAPTREKVLLSTEVSRNKNYPSQSLRLPRKADFR